MSAIQVIELLHNPRYAGAYAWGRRRQRLDVVEGRLIVEHLPRESWQVLIVGTPDGYITWQEYEENQNDSRKTRGLAAS